MDFPQNNIVMSGDNNADFLQSAGVLKQTMVRLQLGPGSLNFAEKFVEPHLAAYRLIDQAEPGVWSSCQRTERPKQHYPGIGKPMSYR